METQVITLPSGDDKEEAERSRTLGLAGGMLQSGEKVGEFQIEGKLSVSGGEAEIYLCLKDNERYILKYYYTKRPNLEVLDRIKSFTHQNINSILDYGEYKERFFIILEYASGGALDDKQENGTFKYLPMSEDDALQVVREIINAFEACHKNGIIHRDIKPGNLLYKTFEALPDGKQKGNGILVSDFGIASIFEVDAGMSKHLTETGARTEGYAAPEVYSGVVGSELDYYSLGVTLWVLLTGMEPFVNEKGHALYSQQIMLNAIQGKTVENLLSRSPAISGFMQKLIRGLLIVRHEKRWKYDEVTRHLAGESIDIFNEIRSLPIIEIGGESCSSYQEIAQAIVKYPEEGKKNIFGGALLKYLIKIDQKLTDRLTDLIESYSAEKRQDECIVFVAYSLCPNMAFPLTHGITISDLSELFTVLETAPEAILPFLRDEKKGFYAYLEAAGLGEQGKKVKEIASATTGDSRLISKIIAAFQGNVIAPFPDGLNNGYHLASIEDLFILPGYLKDRLMIFIERNYGLLPAWIENITGKNIDHWLQLLTVKKERVEQWGAFEYFVLFLQGLDEYDRIQKNGNIILYEKGGTKGLFNRQANSGRGELLFGMEADDKRFVLKKTDGTTVFSGAYAINVARGYDENNFSELPFLDEEGKIAVFDGEHFLYFNIYTCEKSPRHELKDGEIDLLVELTSSLPILDMAGNLKKENNFTDMNSLIEAFGQKLVSEKKYEIARKLLLLIDKDNMDGLSLSYDYYLYQIGFLYNIESSYNESLPFFDEALKLNPYGLDNEGHSYNYLYGITLFCIDVSNLEKAINCFEKAMEIVPKKPTYLRWKGNCQYKQGKYNEAIACLDMALGMKTEPLPKTEKISALETRSYCYNALGMKDKADADLAEAQRLKN